MSSSPNPEPGQPAWPPPGYAAPGYPPGYPVYGQPVYGPPPPENYMVWGVLVTLFCCLPFGIVSIVKANQVNALWAQGQFAAAHAASEDAKRWAMWGAIAAVAITVVLVLVSLVLPLIIMAANSSS